MDNLSKGVPLGTVEIDQYLFTDSSTQGWGAHCRKLQASGLWDPNLANLHINVLELHAVWLGLKAFSSTLIGTNVAIMSDNMSTVAYLKNQGGTRSKQMCDLAVQVCLWAEKEGIVMIPRHIPGYLNVKADSLSRGDQILKTEWSLSQVVANKLFRHWGRPHVDLFALNVNSKLTVFMAPIPEPEA